MYTNLVLGMQERSIKLTWVTKSAIKYTCSRKHNYKSWQEVLNTENFVSFSVSILEILEMFWFCLSFHLQSLIFLLTMSGFYSKCLFHKSCIFPSTISSYQLRNFCPSLTFLMILYNKQYYFVPIYSCWLQKNI